jgi:hypothetical protein
MADLLWFTLLLDRTPLWSSWLPAWLRAQPANQIFNGVLSGFFWLPVEAAALALANRTPGKWLYGIAVCRRDGTALGAHLSIKRTIWVFMSALAFGIRPAAVVLLLLNYRRVLRDIATYWDAHCGTQVRQEDGSPGRIVLAVVVTIALMWLLAQGRTNSISPGTTLIAGY